MTGVFEGFDLYRLLRTLVFATLGLLAIYIEAAPLGLGADALPSPDLLLCVVVYWSIRRPGSTPLALVFGLGLCRDLLTDAPLGAGTLALVLISQILVERRIWLSHQPAVMEWLVFSLAAIGNLAIQWGLLVITLGQPPYLSQIALVAAGTIVSYPVVALIFRWLLRIRWRPSDRAPGARE